MVHEYMKRCSTYPGHYQHGLKMLTSRFLFLVPCFSDWMLSLDHHPDCPPQADVSQVHGSRIDLSPEHLSVYPTASQTFPLGFLQAPQLSTFKTESSLRPNFCPVLGTCATIHPPLPSSLFLIPPFSQLSPATNLPSKYLSQFASLHPICCPDSAPHRLFTWVMSISSYVDLPSPCLTLLDPASRIIAIKVYFQNTKSNMSFSFLK